MTPAVSGSGKSPELSAPGNCKALKDGSLGVCCFLQPFSKCLLLCTGAGGIKPLVGFRVPQLMLPTSPLLDVELDYASFEAFWLLSFAYFV